MPAALSNVRFQGQPGRHGVAQFARGWQNPRVMTGRLTIIKSIGRYVAGWGASVFVAWLGLSQLCRWYATGGLLVSLGRGVDNLRHWQVITYETHPLGLVAHLALY